MMLDSLYRRSIIEPAMVKDSKKLKTFENNFIGGEVIGVQSKLSLTRWLPIDIIVAT